MVNPGSLPLGVTPQNILHKTVKRNEHFANLCYALQMMEREGSGYDKMYEVLLSNGKQIPKVEEGDDYVKAIVERRIISQEAIKVIRFALQVAELRQKQIICLGLIAQHESISATGLIKLLNLKNRDELSPWLDKLIDESIVETSGRKKGKEYRVNASILKQSDYKGTTSLKRIEPYRLRELIIEDLKMGLNIAYSSDAGSPCISDPGEILVKKAIENNIKIVPLPGPNAGLTALIASGLDISHFYFYGFLDSKISKKEAEIAGFLKINVPIIIYESPHRVSETLKSLFKILGNRKIIIARELTKFYEEFIYTTLEEILKNEIKLIGEIVIIIEGNSLKEDIDLDSKIIKLKELKYSNKDIVNIINSLYDVNKNEIKKKLI